MKKLKNLTLAEVRKLAISLATKYANRNVVLGLVGPLGAGKTTFTQAFAKKLGVQKIKSPTFVIASVYPLGSKQFFHFDFYRLESPKQLEPVEFYEILGKTNRIILIEWVDKFPEIQKKCDLVLKFEVASKNQRHVTII